MCEIVQLKSLRLSYINNSELVAEAFAYLAVRKISLPPDLQREVLIVYCEPINEQFAILAEYMSPAPSDSATFDALHPRLGRTLPFFLVPSVGQVINTSTVRRFSCVHVSSACVRACSVYVRAAFMSAGRFPCCAEVMNTFIIALTNCIRTSVQICHRHRGDAFYLLYTHCQGPLHMVLSLVRVRGGPALLGESR
jgi:hypothetical protein